jgi:hypothetical protein
MTLEFHPLANLFPLIEGKEFDALVDDISEHGLREQVVLLDGKVLDGRNRYRALEVLKADDQPRHFIEFEQLWFGQDAHSDPLAYVLSKNLHRRHLNESQRAMVAARLADMPAHRPATDKSANLQTSQASAAEKLNVSTRLVASAKSIQDKGTPELVHAVDMGRIAASVAAQAAKLPAEQQARVVAEVDAGHANAVRTVIKQGG